MKRHLSSSTLVGLAGMALGAAAYLWTIVARPGTTWLVAILAEAHRVLADDQPDRRCGAGRRSGAQMTPADRAAAMREADQHSSRPQYHRCLPRKVGFLRWSWRIVDEAESPHTILAVGETRTEKGAWNRLERAYGQLLDGTVKP